MTNREAKSSRCAVIKHIDREAAETDHFREPFDHFRDVIERVIESAAVRHVRLSETGQVRRDKVETVGKHRNQIAKHVARSWKTAKQQEDRCIRSTRFSIKYFETINLDLAEYRRAHGKSFRACDRTLQTSR